MKTKKLFSITSAIAGVLLAGSTVGALAQTAIYVVLKENERRMNIPATSGWRGRVGAVAN